MRNTLGANGARADCGVACCNQALQGGMGAGSCCPFLYRFLPSSFRLGFFLQAQMPLYKGICVIP
jgi:hypothetical protein